MVVKDLALYSEKKYANGMKFELKECTENDFKLKRDHSDLFK